jgi:hypothetical protein
MPLQHYFERSAQPIEACKRVYALTQPSQTIVTHVSAHMPLQLYFERATQRIKACKLIYALTQPSHTLVTPRKNTYVLTALLRTFLPAH